jgi:HAD superfamily hydrolase (TIGR01509 family)
LNIHPEDLVKSKRKHFKEIFDNDQDFQMIDGALDLIKNLVSNNITLILASSASMTNINRIFQKFDLDKFFKAKISGADLKESKPNPEIFIKAAKLSGYSKKHCIVIEDSTNGIIAAKSAGIFCVGYNSVNSKNQNYDIADLEILNLRDVMFNLLSKKI